MPIPSSTSISMLDIVKEFNSVSLGTIVEPISRVGNLWTFTVNKGNILVSGGNLLYADDFTLNETAWGRVVNSTVRSTSITVDITWYGTTDPYVGMPIGMPNSSAPNLLPIDQYYRGSPLVPSNSANVNIPTSGAISFSNFYGGSGIFEFTFGGGTNVNLRSLAVTNGWNQSSQVKATNTGNIISSSAGSYALTIDGSFPGGVDFVNNGLIVGRGGDGGVGARVASASQITFTSVPAGPGSSGGPALIAGVPVRITNNGTINGGGGGGGGGGSLTAAISRSYNGGGGGGGGGGIGGSTGGLGGPSSRGGVFWPNVTVSIVSNGADGNNGSATTAGFGGSGGSSGFSPYLAYGGAAGAGGGGGSSGGTGSNPFASGGAAIMHYQGGQNGGASGAAVNGNGNITWVLSGNINGAVV